MSFVVGDFMEADEGSPNIGGLGNDVGSGRGGFRGCGDVSGPRGGKGGCW